MFDPAGGVAGCVLRAAAGRKERRRRGEVGAFDAGGRGIWRRWVIGIFADGVILLYIPMDRCPASYGAVIRGKHAKFIPVCSGQPTPTLVSLSGYDSLCLGFEARNACARVLILVVDLLMS